MRLYQIENMARMANVTVSVVINMLIASSIDDLSLNLDNAQLQKLLKSPQNEYKPKLGLFGILKKSTL
jgi:hypothetical protein